MALMTAVLKLYLRFRLYNLDRQNVNVRLLISSAVHILKRTWKSARYLKRNHQDEYYQALVRKKYVKNYRL